MGLQTTACQFYCLHNRCFFLTLCLNFHFCETRDKHLIISSTLEQCNLKKQNAFHKVNTHWLFLEFKNIKIFRLLSPVSHGILEFLLKFPDQWIFWYSDSEYSKYHKNDLVLITRIRSNNSAVRMKKKKKTQLRSIFI